VRNVNKEDLFKQQDEAEQTKAELMMQMRSNLSLQYDPQFNAKMNQCNLVIDEIQQLLSLLNTGALKL